MIVDSGSSVLLTIIGIAVLVWLLLLVVQLSDLAASLLDVRGAHDTGKPGRPARRRYSEYFWTIPLTATALVVVVAGSAVLTSYTAYLSARVGVGLLLAIVVFALVVAIAIVVALTRGERYSYGQLVANLTADTGQRLSSAHVALFRSQLGEIDGRRRRIHLGFLDRANIAWLRAELDDLAAAFRVVPPTGLGAVDAVRLRTAHTYLWRGNILRLVPAFLALAVAALVIVQFVQQGLDGALPAILLAFIPVVVSYLVAIPSARFALAAKVAWHAVNLSQRSVAVDLIEEFERSSRKGVAGLGDRVARALQILRDQQE